MARIPATIITGFLGAGKTSLIRHLLANADGRRLALIINEFGDLGVDRELVTACGDAACPAEDVVELTNGCICCTVADDFLPTIEMLLGRAQPPDHIIIETSGLALPKPLVKAFNWPEVRARVTVDGVVAVIDAEAVAAGRFAADPAAVQAQREADPGLDHENPLEEVFEEQIQCADLVIVNKADRVSDRVLDQVMTGVGALLRPAVKMLPAAQGAVDPRVFLGLKAAAEDDLDSRPSHHELEGVEHDHDDFAGFVVDLPAIADIEGLERRILDAVEAHDILRIKGFIDVPGKSLRLALQGVGPRLQRYYDRPWKPGEPRRSALVVIGQKGLDRAAITAMLRG
jgi:cobalamin biosynthesis protein CobW